MEIETKSSVISGTDGVEILHNNFITRTSNLIATQQTLLPADDEDHIGSRIGDKITLSGGSIKAMFELNERYSDVTMRMFVIRSAKGDTPNNTTLWNSAFRNRMIDTINIERFTSAVGDGDSKISILAYPIGSVSGLVPPLKKKKVIFNVHKCENDKALSSMLCLYVELWCNFANDRNRHCSHGPDTESRPYA